MATQRILADRWEGVMNYEEIIEPPTRAEFNRLFNRLDRRTYTMMVIKAAGDCHMAVGGGDGQYVVYATFDNEVFWNLVRSDGGSGTLMLNVGGQEGDFPARQVVEEEQARQAGLTFLQSGQLDRDLIWEKA